MGRRRKWANAKERYRAWARAHQGERNAVRRKRPSEMVNWRLGADAVEVIRPPFEVLRERDYRIGILVNRTETTANFCGDPPRGYAPAYYHVAWRNQRRIARGTLSVRVT